MIDKIWYDWQRQDPSNKNAFGGGTVSWQVNSSFSLLQYPIGAPPWLDVRCNSLPNEIAMGVLTFNRHGP